MAPRRPLSMLLGRWCLAAGPSRALPLTATAQACPRRTAPQRRHLNSFGSTDSPLAHVPFATLKHFDQSRFGTRAKTPSLSHCCFMIGCSAVIRAGRYGSGRNALLYKVAADECDHDREG